MFSAYIIHTSVVFSNMSNMQFSPATMLKLQHGALLNFITTRNTKALALSIKQNPLGEDDYIKVMEHAATLGYHDIVMTMVNLMEHNYIQLNNISKLPDYIVYNRIMVAAAGGDHQSIVDQMIKFSTISTKSLSNVKHDMYVAYNSAMLSAASGGHQNIVSQMIEMGADAYSLAMCFAAGEGHVNIVNQMIVLGADNFNGAMLYAARGNHQAIVELMISLGGNDYIRAIKVALACGNHYIADQLLVMYDSRDDIIQLP